VRAAAELLRSQQKPKTKKQPKKPNATVRVGLPACTAQYYKIIRNPWTADCRDACTPSYPAPPSQKVVVDTYVDITAGANGSCFLAWSPSAYSDVQQIVYGSGVAFLQNNGDVQLNAATVGLTAASMTRLPYVQANALSAANQRLKARIVALGLEAEYTGTILNRSGQWAIGHHPNHSFPFNAANNNMSWGDFLASPGVLNKAVNGTKIRTAGFAVDIDEINYPGDNAVDAQIQFPWSEAPSTGAYGAVGLPAIVFSATGMVAGSGIHLKFRFVIEYSGSSIQTSLLTPSHADSDGLAKVQSAAQAASLGEHNSSESWGSLLDGAMKDVFKYAMPVAMDFARASARSTRTRLDRLEL